MLGNAHFRKRGCRASALALGLGVGIAHADPNQSGQRYAPLTQINRDNVADLDIAWTYRTGELERRGERFARMQSFEATPELVGDALVVCTAAGRIVALHPSTGTERWVFDPNPRAEIPEAIIPKCRGVAQWLDERAPAGAICRRRIVFGTWDFRIFAIDAGTGQRCPGFGSDGMVSFEPDKPLEADEFLQYGSPPAIAGDVAIFGSSQSDGIRPNSPRGTVRAIDLRTGALRWSFEPIPPDPTDPAAATWLAGSADRTGNANAWTRLAVDAERGLVFVPTSSAGVDFYGGLRPGANRYANSLVALDAASGAVVWHYQIVHHDIWDYDLPAQPILAELPRDGTTVPAVIQLTKQGLIFTFHRETGEPLYPIDERPVPQAGASGEWLAPTQPFPRLPPPLTATSVAPDDAWGFTPWDRGACRRRIEALRHGPLYTPPSVQGTIVMPSFIGGANWGGGAYDPTRNLLVVNTLHAPGIVQLIARAPGDDGAGERMELGGDVDVNAGVTFPQRGTPYRVLTKLLVSPLGAPCTAPPWGRLTAVDMAKGTIRWQVPLGSLEKQLPLPWPLEYGTPSAGGAIVTAAGLAFIAATADDNFRAYDLDSGRVLWKTRLPAGGQAIPVTYEFQGRQFIAIAAGGSALYQTTTGDYVIAYALPARAR